MINNNKISRVILALLMTLSINIFSTSITNARPVEDSYYNPYTHSNPNVEVENKTFGANGESNSDRQARKKREAQEAKRKAEEAKKAAEEAEKAAEEAEKAKRYASLPDASNESQKSNYNATTGNEDKTNEIEKKTSFDSNNVHSEAYNQDDPSKLEDRSTKSAKDGEKKFIWLGVVAIVGIAIVVVAGVGGLVWFLKGRTATPPIQRGPYPGQVPPNNQPLTKKSPKFCTACGAPVSAGSNFCVKCGNKW